MPYKKKIKKNLSGSHQTWGGEQKDEEKQHQQPES